MEESVENVECCRIVFEIRDDDLRICKGFDVFVL